jgi:hypothetical protein
MTDRSNNPLDWNRVLSLIVGGCAITFYGVAGGVASVLRSLPAILLLVACIWFPYELGDATNQLPLIMGPRSIDRPSPGCMIRLIAWVALAILAFGPFVAVLLFRVGWL